MSGTTDISWTDATWNPTVGCTKVSPGCLHCYAATLDKRFHRDGPYVPWTVAAQRKAGVSAIHLHTERMFAPLHWKQPRRIFVNSMSDLFHEDVPDDFIDQVFAVMALAPQHVFQCLSKRPERMLEYLASPVVANRVMKAADSVEVHREIAAMGPERIEPIEGSPGYFITDRGRVLSASGSARCLFCGNPVSGIATKAYCDVKCKYKASFYRRTGRPRDGERYLTEMHPDVSDDGYLRVELHVNGDRRRDSVHRLVLTTFGGSASPELQACHRDGNPSNNALPNLRWGTQSDNWNDRRRHHHSEWPLRNVWIGVSCENQRYADERLPLLAQCPAAVRFVSVEPMLGPVDLRPYLYSCGCGQIPCSCKGLALNWVIVGGESGPGYRPMKVEWAQGIADQADAAGVPVWMKQDSGPRPGQQGRIPDSLWARKETP